MTQQGDQGNKYSLCSQEPHPPHPCCQLKLTKFVSQQRFQVQVMLGWPSTCSDSDIFLIEVLYPASQYSPLKGLLPFPPLYLSLPAPAPPCTAAPASVLEEPLSNNRIHTSCNSTCHHRPGPEPALDNHQGVTRIRAFLCQAFVHCQLSVQPAVLCYPSTLHRGRRHREPGCLHTCPLLDTASSLALSPSHFSDTAHKV